MSDAGFERSLTEDSKLRALITETDCHFSERVIGYFMNFGWRVDPSVNLFMSWNFGMQDPRFLPSRVYRNLQRFFNERAMGRAYSDKNMYEVLVRTSRQPRNLIKCVNGRYFDEFNKGFIEFSHLVNGALSPNSYYVLKPSRTANGRGVKKVYFDGDGFYLGGRFYSTLSFEFLLEERYKQNYLIQDLLKQSQAVSSLHDKSINTLRMLTFRWRGEIHYLQGFLRVGTSDKINDNAGAGGVCVGVEDDGALRNYFISEGAAIYTAHPASGFDLSKEDFVIENFHEYVDFVRRLHLDVPHHDLISWDIAIGEDSLPIFIEHNFAGVMWLYQAATGKPIFGDLTEEVLGDVVSGELICATCGVSSCSHSGEIS